MYPLASPGSAPERGETDTKEAALRAKKQFLSFFIC